MQSQSDSGGVRGFSKASLLSQLLLLDVGRDLSSALSARTLTCSPTMWHGLPHKMVAGFTEQIAQERSDEGCITSYDRVSKVRQPHFLFIVSNSLKMVPVQTD